MTGPLATIPHMPPSKRSGRPGQVGSSVARAALSSGAATAIDGAVYQVALVVCAELAVASRPAYMVAATVGAVFGAVCNFSLNRWWVFRSSGKLGHEGLRYVIGLVAHLVGDAACAQRAHHPCFSRPPRSVAPGQVVHVAGVLLSIPEARRVSWGSSMMWRHMLKLWPRFTLAPMLPFWGWAIYFALRYQFRWDQFAVAILVTALAYGNSWTKRLFIGLLPIGLVGLFYDAMRVVKNVGLTPANVHVCDLRKAELTWFGVAP